MKNQIMLLMLGIILLTSIANVSAVQYFQDRYFVGNDTTRVHASLFWDIGYLTPDHVTGGNKLQTYIYYNIYPADWNSQNALNYSVQYCNIQINFFKEMDNSSTLIYNATYTSATDDIYNAKYFVELEQNDGYTADIDCKFAHQRPSRLELPADFSMVTPSWECKACQMYKWNLLEQQTAVTKNVGDNTLEVFDFIKKLVYLNFEILIAIFWLIMIGFVFLAFSLIFTGIYWLFLYLKRVARI